MKLDNILNILESLKEKADFSKDKGMFSLKKLASIKDSGRQIEYAYHTLGQENFIGKGSSRIVFNFKGKALKIAMDSKGASQNAVEYRVGQEGYSVVAETYTHGPEYKFIIAELATPYVNTSKFSRLTGMNFDDFYQYIMEFYEAHLSDQPSRRITKSRFRDRNSGSSIAKYPWTKEVLSIIKKYALPANDLYGNNLGTVIRNGEEHVVLIDVGFNQQVHGEFYDTSIRKKSPVTKD